MKVDRESLWPEHLLEVDLPECSLTKFDLGYGSALDGVHLPITFLSVEMWGGPSSGLLTARDPGRGLYPRPTPRLLRLCVRSLEPEPRSQLGLERSHPELLREYLSALRASVRDESE